jgi:hypothetical protein
MTIFFKDSKENGGGENTLVNILKNCTLKYTELTKFTQSKRLVLYSVTQKLLNGNKLLVNVNTNP